MRTIVHLSDLHFGRIDPLLPEPLVESVEAVRPDLVAVSGDLTQRARTEEFEQARAFLDALPSPQIVVPGNHDVPLYNAYLRFFGGLLGRPQLTWSEQTAKRALGHYDSAHNMIVVSRVFDRPSSPRYAIEYLLYHEMLHLRHPVRRRGLRRSVHSREFKAEEALFPQLKEALAFIQRL